MEEGEEISAAFCLLSKSPSRLVQANGKAEVAITALTPLPVARRIKNFESEEDLRRCRHLLLLCAKWLRTLGLQT